MNTSFDYISEITGLTAEDLKNHYNNQCFVCYELDNGCDNGLFNHIEKCKLFSASVDLKDWWINLKKAIYELKIPYASCDGSIIDEESDATTEFLNLLNTDEEAKSYFINKWATNFTPENAVLEWLDDHMM